MRAVEDCLPWKVTDISFRPYEDMWSMNPSVHFDGQLWRCVLRCTDYAMPDGRTIRSSRARPAGNQTRNAMVILDPQSWKSIRIHKMHERDEVPRTPCANLGYEDMRIFQTDRGGLQGIAASFHLARGARPMGGGPQNQPPEQVLLSFDAQYDIVRARPIRGDWWSGSPQKNWVPFDGCAEPRFLYSIDRGTMFDDQGALHGEGAAVSPSARDRPLPLTTLQLGQRGSGGESKPRSPEETPEPRREKERKDLERREKERKDLERRNSRRSVIRGADIQLGLGRRVSLDSLSSRPSSSSRRSSMSESSSTRALSSGRALPPKYAGLRGGSQLVRVGAEAWLGIGHEMQFLKSRKMYWHTWYLVDSRGKMMASSEPMKLASNGIEFAAGMGLDGDRLVVSFGVDDMESKLGETRLSAVMEALRAVER